MANRAELHLHFDSSGRENPILSKTWFLHPEEGERTAVQGEVKPPNAPGCRLFDWTDALKSCCVLLVRSAAWARRGQSNGAAAQPVLKGNRPSLATSLSDALDKRETSWLSDIFNSDAKGKPLILRFIKRKPNSQKPELWLDCRQLPPGNIKVFLDDEDKKPVEDPNKLEELADRIEKQWKPKKKPPEETPVMAVDKTSDGTEIQERVPPASQVGQTDKEEVPVRSRELRKQVLAARLQALTAFTFHALETQAQFAGNPWALATLDGSHVRMFHQAMNEFKELYGFNPFEEDYHLDCPTVNQISAALLRLVNSLDLGSSKGSSPEDRSSRVDHTAGTHPPRFEAQNTPGSNEPLPAERKILPRERDRIRGERNTKLTNTLLEKKGILKCGIMQLEDHTDKGYLLDVDFDESMTCAAEVLSTVRSTIDALFPEIPYWGEMKIESENSVTWAYTWIDQWNRWIRS